MEDIVELEGEDYRAYTSESKRAIAAAASTACSINAVLDTPVLKEDGKLTEDSKQITEQIEGMIYQ